MFSYLRESQNYNLFQCSFYKNVYIHSKWQVFYTLKIKNIMYNCIHRVLYNLRRKPVKKLLSTLPCLVNILFVCISNKKQFLGYYKNDSITKHILVGTQNKKPVDTVLPQCVSVYLFICNGPHINSGSI